MTSKAPTKELPVKPAAAAIPSANLDWMKAHRTELACGALLGATLIGTYWTPLAGLVHRWWSDPDYLHGFLVPAFAVFLLWYRRDMLKKVRPVGSLWGLGLLGVCAALRWISAYFYYELLDPVSLMAGLAGVALFVGGWRVLRWSWPAIAFLIFMVPLPGFAANLMGHPLQRLATIASTYTIQTIGVSAVAEGNVISLADSQIGVAEACNGLRNLMLFLTICVGAACVMKRTPWEKAIVVLSAAPIAVIANVFRITATAILHAFAKHELANISYHDLAGFFMMPLAVVLLWIELSLLSRIFVDDTLDAY